MSTRTRHGAAASFITILLAALFHLAGSVTTNQPVSAKSATSPFGDTVTINGHGNGHGDGMSQWGAYGYAVNQSWSWQQILDHYYGGTTLSTVDPGSTMTVNLRTFEDVTATAMVNEGGHLAVNVGPTDGRYRAVVAVESDGATDRYRVYGRADVMSCPASTDPAAFDAPVSGWSFLGETVSSSLATAIDVTSAGTDPTTANPADLVSVCEPNGRIRAYRGALRVVNGTTHENRTVNVLSLDSYVRGVVPREVAASWADAGGGRGANAVAAQAVAARTYSMAEHRNSYAKTCDTTACQAYGGAGVRSSLTAPWDVLEDSRSDAAVAATAAVVLLKGGSPAYAQFSASTGGYTSGANFPAVVDEGDGVAQNPSHSWTAKVPVATFEAAYPSIGTLLAIDVTKRNGLGDFGGRALAVTIRGTSGSVVVSGESFRMATGLRSAWVQVIPACSPSAAGAAAPLASPSNFHPMTPVRVLDTRIGTGAAAQPLDRDCSLPIGIAGNFGVPASGVRAAVLNVTAVDATDAGFLTVYPCAAGRPDASNVNYGAGAVVANMVTVALDERGQVCVFTHQPTHVVVDLLGYYGDGPAGQRFTTASPERIVDTRTGLGADKTPVPGGTVQVVAVPGGSAATGIALNVTATRSKASGFLTVYSCDAALPTTSNVNYLMGSDVANHVISAVSAGGTVCVFTKSTTDVVIDVLGTFAPSGSLGFVATVPSRLEDTRTGSPTRPAARTGADGVVVVPVVGRGVVPAKGVGAVVLNVTATGADGSGFLTAYPCGNGLPVASNLNYARDLDVANLVTVAPGSDGTVCIFSHADTDIVVDLAGWYA